MKSLKTLWMYVADELATWCRTSTTRDYQTVASRVEHEGVSFLTISLPAFGKDFERCLEQGCVDDEAFHGFKREKSGPLPLFLGGFLRQVFDKDGSLLDESLVSVDSIFAVRQLTLMFGKILLDCSEERTRGAIRNYIECERELRDLDASTTMESLSEFRRVSSLLWADVFTAVEDSVLSGDVYPKHGPGATADKLRGNAKFDQIEWPARLEVVFPFGDHVLPNWRYHANLERVKFTEPEAERPAKVITVPKTLKTPRIIAIEPTCMQYMQQALLGRFVEEIENKRTTRSKRDNLAFDFVGFTEQQPNRDLSRIGSCNGELATLDLSEASDRVLNSHVLALFSRWPALSEAVQATRTTKASVPGHGEIPLTKFASMGSALCFPVEMMVFLTVVFLGIQDELNRPITRKDIESFRGRVRIYGDDIIVPVEYVHSVIDALSLYGHKVNVNKSFWNGKFRESCGGDYYDGVDVTPVRVRRDMPSSRSDVPEVTSLVSFRNLLYYRGLWKTCEKLDTWIEEKFLPHFPKSKPESPVLGRNTFLSVEGDRMCPNLHKPLVKGYVEYSKPPASRLDGIGALRKCLAKRSEEPFVDAKHLERQGRPRAVGIKLRWISPV